MDWQTKEYIDEKFEEFSEKLDALLRHFNIEEDDNDEDEDINFDEDDQEEELTNKTKSSIL